MRRPHCPSVLHWCTLADMSEARRRGRPPTDQTNPTGRGSYHLGLRLADERRDQLLRIVTAANERARAAVLPATVTASQLVTLWIVERLDVETAKLAKKR
jgi:hypothetical protein